MVVQWISSVPTFRIIMGSISTKGRFSALSGNGLLRTVGVMRTASHYMLKEPAERFSKSGCRHMDILSSRTG